MQLASLFTLSTLWTVAFAQMDRIFQSPPIRVPDEVAANTPFQARLWIQEIGGNTDYIAGFRVYLAWARPNMNSTSYRERCYLINTEPICNPTIELTNKDVYYKNTTFQVTVPASVGPSGKHYVLMMRTINTDGTYYGMWPASNVFYLTGGTGAWASFELQGNTLWGDDGIFCGGYDCVRRCAASGILNYTSKNNGYENCANSCPSVFIDPSSTRGGQATASLTQATPCSLSQTPASSTTTSFGNPTATRTRSAAAAAGTGAASSFVDMNYFVFAFMVFVCAGCSIT
ncbi:hypothetical protein B0J11DRAFT_178672 [Dendryphion nanum]|uniref:Uncharacterized protein n=1 Tax=Dendryphion nanum TaxID=256645 RepID=A0A9P9EED5_9PLEO|nr:hypothetical protein B0J11DRAFT_178672 [Dendryphion nanum]